MSNALMVLLVKYSLPENNITNKYLYSVGKVLIYHVYRYESGGKKKMFSRPYRVTRKLICYNQGIIFLSFAY